MKILTINTSDITGGAARAAYRLHKALIESRIDCEMWVNYKKSDDWTVISPSNSIEKSLNALKPHVVNLIKRSHRSRNPIIHSPSILPSRWVKRINASDSDLVNLHWVQHEMLSIADIPRIKKPIVWTLHDMWAFCGAEHYTDDDRWRSGYRRNNRPPHESGFDLNLWTWQRKLKHWQQEIQIVTPSQWLAEGLSPWLRPPHILCW